ncbi:MAG: hypothetical protein WCJ69_07480 [Betaproteobacteria bacterium]|jgi:hypothetical protein
MAVLGISASAMTEGQDRIGQRARTDFLLHCSGCHGMDGMGKPEKGIPRFRDQIGHFLQLPDGRAFIMQVPGLLSARLPDDRAAAVTNWLVREFAGPSMPAGATLMSAEEARQYRESRPADIMAKRDMLYRKLSEVGYAIEP